MKRRESIKSILLGAVATGAVLTGCKPSEKSSVDVPKIPDLPPYGRTKKETLRDQKLLKTHFFNEHELSTIAVLCDIILPKSGTYNSASDAEVKEFIDFIVRDLEVHQTPLRGGIMWLDHFSNKTYNKTFIACSNKEQFYICDQIAYPGKTKPKLKQGEAFFTRMRNLTLTGYYTSKIGIEELGYKGNTPNIWDGVPDHILSKHGFKYEKEWLSKCVNNSNRASIAQWDSKGNLIN